MPLTQAEAIRWFEEDTAKLVHILETVRDLSRVGKFFVEPPKPTSRDECPPNEDDPPKEGPPVPKEETSRSFFDGPHIIWKK